MARSHIKLERGSALRQREVYLVFEEILRAVAELSDGERLLLRQQIDALPEKTARLTPKERARRLNAALDSLSDGLSQAQLDEMTAAMTEDYTESWDESLWTQ